MDSRLKYLNVTSTYMLVHGAFEYSDNTVICVLVEGQYLLMPHGTLAQTVTHYSNLPDGLKLRVLNDKMIEVGHLRQSIRDTAKKWPGVDALATWTELKPGDHYRLITSEGELVRTWVEQYLKDAQIEPNRSFGITLSSSPLWGFSYTGHGFTVVFEDMGKFTGVVKLHTDSTLHSIYSTWDCTHWVWSPSLGKLWKGSPKPELDIG